MYKNIKNKYWDSIIEKTKENFHYNLWETHMKGVHEKLIEQWFSDFSDGFVLKTDLYEEATGIYGLMSILEQKNKAAFGIDISEKVVHSARRIQIEKHNSQYCMAVTDIRKAAIKTCTFDQVISNSTLDHFHNKQDILLSLKELWRIMKPGGKLIVTLDNRSNPFIFLRNLLPYRFLHYFGIIPFYMGITVSMNELICMLRSNGFIVHDNKVIVHFPRIFGIRIGYMLNLIGNNKLKNYFIKMLEKCESLEKFPTRNQTGYFNAVKAVKI